MSESTQINGVSFSVKLRDDVTVEEAESGRITLVRNDRRFPEMPDNPLVERLAHDWMTEESVDQLAESAADPPVIYYLCAKLFSLGLLIARCTAGVKPLFSLLPAPDWHEWQGRVLESSGRLSSHASLRREDNYFVLEMPLSSRKCLIHDKKCLVWLMEITRNDVYPAVEDEARAAFYWALCLMGVLDQWGDDHTIWESHDLAFFHHSSIGFHDDPIGATWRLKDKLPPTPLFKAITGQCVPLPEPDQRLIEKLSAPFAKVLANRRSGRIPGERPITISELGALLHVAAGVQEVRDDPDLPCPVSFRPSPSGGALHSLEVYPLAYQCEGLAPGAWRYDPSQHRMESVPVNDRLLDAYLKANPHALVKGAGLPHIRLVITSRFGREVWKYEKIAYRLVLQDLGCLYQTLSLTAETLGLSSCILGVVDARNLGALLNLDPLAEPVIGEMTLSSR